MFIREILTRRTANKTYRSVRVVESRRVGRKVQQKMLLNLGAGFSIPKAQWPELVEIIEAKLAGNEYLFEPAPELAAAAESIVQRLRSRELEKPTDESLDGDTAHIKLNSVEMDNGRSAGSDLHRPSNQSIFTSIFDKTYLNQYVEEISEAICIVHESLQNTDYT